ncbi:hypothetical protein [Saccharopolyspora gloriosae]|uniref:hypothetical protein n=1 Tax=Saccharopolyspora gloriosae TaxID=455344 RepID=UPI001FB82029|nr:hypothetical protein [Saccharopolyspora gloriosae]
MGSPTVAAGERSALRGGVVAEPGPRGFAPSVPRVVSGRAGWLAAVRECAWLAVVGACAFVGVLLFGMLALDSGARPVPDATAVARVTDGDTLWSVAARSAPDSDQRAVVGRIVELNHLDVGGSRLGGTLIVPAQRG